MQILRKKPRWERIEEIALMGVFVAYFIGLLALLLGCTIAPKPVTPTQVPFSGNSSAGGVLARLSDGAFEIVADRRAAYDDLIAKGFGRAFLPPLAKDAGIRPLPDGNFEIDDQHLVDFAAMAARFRRGEKP